LYLYGFFYIKLKIKWISGVKVCYFFGWKVDDDFEQSLDQRGQFWNLKLKDQFSNNLKDLITSSDLLEIEKRDELSPSTQIYTSTLQHAVILKCVLLLNFFQTIFSELIFLKSPSVETETALSSSMNHVHQRTVADETGTIIQAGS
jgi:hypothetical protein